MTRGWYRCPIPGCDHREYVQSLIDQHVRQAHPEENP